MATIRKRGDWQRQTKIRRKGLTTGATFKNKARVGACAPAISATGWDEELKIDEL